MAYAHAQKNCGISGTTVIIVKDSFLKTNPCTYIPSICDFRVYQEKGGFP
jgi:phosphoserine aminotransferase